MSRLDRFQRFLEKIVWFGFLLSNIVFLLGLLVGVLYLARLVIRLF